MSGALPLAVFSYSSALFALGLAILTWILLRRSYAYFGRRQGAGHREPSGGSRETSFHGDPRRPADAPPEMLRWQVAMHDLARDVQAELDSKIRVFRTIVALAESEAVRLEAAIARAEKLGISTERNTLDEIERLAEVARAGLGQSTLSAVSEKGLWPAAGAEKRRTIYALADAGQSPAAIAGEVGLPVGEVEMILSLRPADRTPPAAV
jgi:hypothetical protein